MKPQKTCKRRWFRQTDKPPGNRPPQAHHIPPAKRRNAAQHGRQTALEPRRRDALAPRVRTTVHGVRGTRAAGLVFSRSRPRVADTRRGGRRPAALRSFMAAAGTPSAPFGCSHLCARLIAAERRGNMYRRV
eukprot:828362-Prymnesium_polylepis.1